MKRIVRKNSYDFMQEELNFFQEKNIISPEQSEEIMNHYEIKEKLSFIRIVLTIGAILVGLGILSLVASNWQIINSYIKILIIVGLMTVSFFASYKTSLKYEKTSKALLYLSTIIFGAGIFLIGQMFNISGDFAGAFLIWGLGVIGVSYLFNDKALYIFSVVLFMIYMSMNMNIQNQTGLYVILLLLASEAVVRQIDQNSIVCFFNNLKLVYIVIWTLSYIELKDVYSVWLIMAIGLLMNYLKQKEFVHIYKIQGRIIIGITGIILTFDDVWNSLLRSDSAQIVAVIIGLALFIYFLVYVRKQSVISLVFLCILVFRYYMDTLFSFLPKSLFFIVGGLILIGFGFYFERIRKKTGGFKNEIEIK